MNDAPVSRDPKSPDHSSSWDHSHQSYAYAPPLVAADEWIHENITNDPIGKIKRYFLGLFPILSWIYRYNLTWATGDLIAGITVGVVVVPQSMSYAKIATLPVQYGLYSSFVGVFIYCFFATSKDVTIGPVAVMSLQTAHVIATIQMAHPNEFTPQLIATTLAFFCGIITLGIGILRLGWLIEFIPYPTIAGFMTGSAITIAVGQIPSLLGTSSLYDTRAACYLVIINTLKYLPQTKLDAAFGLPCLFFLYAYRSAFKWASRHYPQYKRWFFFALVLRQGLVIIFITIISWVVCRSNPNNPPISILKTVPKGFQNVGTLKINTSLASALASEIPISTVVLLLEHIAISKSFGRINDYKIVPGQELTAIGVTNLIGTFFNAYPATGSFSRTAIKSMAGVRTPLAGIYTGLVVILALYALTSAFYWIPSAGLAAIIIHAVGDLIVSPSQSYRFWKIAPFDLCIFLASVIVTIFTTLEIGIYVSFGISMAILLYRVARPGGEFLGRVRIKIVEGEDPSRSQVVYHDTYVPLRRKNLNPNIHVEDAPPGILIYRFEESFTFPNSSLINDRIVDYAKEKTRRGCAVHHKTLGDRPWNEGFVPRSMDKLLHQNENDNRPLLHAVVYDFSAVSAIDTTSVQALIDTRQQLDRYSDREVEYHFVCILDPWIKRGLVAGGFGVGKPGHRLVEVASMVPIADAEDPRTHGEEEFQRRRRATQPSSSKDIEASLEIEQISEKTTNKAWSLDSHVPIVATNYPFFHLDLQAAVRSAEKSLRAPG